MTLQRKNQKIILSYKEIFSFENLFSAWQEFRRGKKHKKDVALFSARLIDNLKSLERDFKQDGYHHGGYVHFRISDPKPRDIHKASVRDRVVHHTLYRALYPYFDRLFIHDSYSCRCGKGSHRALDRFKSFSQKVSKNDTKTCWVLQCDIRKCFASIDHGILKSILKRHISCARTMKIVDKVIGSFRFDGNEKGIPLGNLTSQLFVNVYLNQLDQYVKRIIGEQHYIRYADDFVFFSRDRKYLHNLIPNIKYFLEHSLRLSLHPKKVSVRTIASGVDFLGWVHFPKHRVLRTVTKKRMMRVLAGNKKQEIIASYHGLLQHGNTYFLQESLDCFSNKKMIR
jgi:retron-type reverse transcriptase